MVDLERLLNAKQPASKKHNPSKFSRPRKKPAKPVEHQEYVHGSSEEEPVGHLSLVQMVAQIYKSMYKYMLYIYIMYFTYNIMYIYIHIYIYMYTHLYICPYIHKYIVYVYIDICIYIYIYVEVQEYVHI